MSDPAPTISWWCRLLRVRGGVASDRRPKVTVCLLEAGGRDKSVLIHAPAGVVAMVPTKINNYGYQTVPQPGLNGRRGYQPRGRTLGGSSSINAMLYVRGNKSDYDHWASLGNPGWSYSDVLPLFQRSENNEQFKDGFHGQGGPLNVTYPRHESPCTKLFLDAAALHQIRLNPDYNGAEQEGAFEYQVTHKNGERCSAAKAYLSPNLSRKNLEILVHAVSAKVAIENRRACGVSYYQGDELKEVRARREVILAGGAFGSPQLLQLSGIGAGEELKKLGIPVVNELPGVGKNLQDHIDYVQSWRVPSNTETVGASLRGAAKITSAMFEWRNKRSGLITTTYATAGAFLRSSPDVLVPDLQLVFVIALVDDHARKLHMGHGISCHVEVLRPYSRGTVKLNSKDPRDTPIIDPQFLSDERDMSYCSRERKFSNASWNPNRSIRCAARCCTRRGSTIPPAWKGIFVTGLILSTTRSEPARWAQRLIPWRWSIPVCWSRASTAASSGCLDHAHGGRGQYQCAVDHDRGTSRRHDLRGRLKHHELSRESMAGTFSDGVDIDRRPGVS